MITTLIFNRNHGNPLDVFAVVNFNCAHTQDPKVLIELFRTATAKWMKNSESGGRALAYSGEAFNIGDFASYTDDEQLKECLSEEGLTVEIMLMNEPDSVLHYDTPLVREEDIEEDVG